MKPVKRIDGLKKQINVVVDLKTHNLLTRMADVLDTSITAILLEQLQPLFNKLSLEYLTELKEIHDADNS